MAVVVVVSRNPMLAMGIGGAFDVIDVRPPALTDTIAERAGHVDAFVLDVHDSARARRAVDQLRGTGDDAPVLVVASHSPAWHDDDVLQLPGAHLLPLPVDRSGLVSALRDLVANTARRERTPAAARPGADAQPARGGALGETDGEPGATDQQREMGVPDRPAVRPPGSSPAADSGGPEPAGRTSAPAEPPRREPWAERADSAGPPSAPPPPPPKPAESRPGVLSDATWAAILQATGEVGAREVAEEPPPAAGPREATPDVPRRGDRGRGSLTSRLRSRFRHRPDDDDSGGEQTREAPPPSTSPGASLDDLLGSARPASPPGAVATGSPAPAVDTASRPQTRDQPVDNRAHPAVMDDRDSDSAVVETPVLRGEPARATSPAPTSDPLDGKAGTTPTAAPVDPPATGAVPSPSPAGSALPAGDEADTSAIAAGERTPATDLPPVESTDGEATGQDADRADVQAVEHADEQPDDAGPPPVDRPGPATDTTTSADTDTTTPADTDTTTPTVTDDTADLESLAALEADAARLAELEAEAEALAVLEAEAEALAELEAEAEALAELEAEALRLAALEEQAARVADLEQQARRVTELEARTARLGELERQARRIAELEAQASKLPFLEAQARRVVELEAQVSRLADVEAATEKARRHRARPARLSAPPDSLQVSQLVELFVTRADELFGVADTGEVIVNAAIEQTGAEAAALLLPDGGRWRVAAGHNLRPLERRYELSDTSWLVTQVAWQRRGVIVQDTDIARRALRGAPLASWHHLLAAPIPGVQGLLVLARAQDPPFGERDLSALVALAREAAPLIVEALSVRQLARLLSRFRDDQDNPSQV